MRKIIDYVRNILNNNNMFKNLSGRNMIRLLDEYTRSRYYREDTLALQVAEEGQSNNHTEHQKSVAAAKAKR